MLYIYTTLSGNSSSVFPASSACVLTFGAELACTVCREPAPFADRNTVSLCDALRFIMLRLSDAEAVAGVSVDGDMVGVLSECGIALHSSGGAELALSSCDYEQKVDTIMHKYIHL